VKKYSAVLALFFLTFTINAQSVWTGNASVGGSSDFPGKSDVFRAASNSFPVGTVLRVTNPRDGAEIDVTVTGRLETPGIFILIEDAAASFIGLPDDHVLPVRVSPVSRTPAPEPETFSEGKNELTEDTDYNPAAVLTEKKDESTPESETIITYDLASDSDDVKSRVPDTPESVPETEKSGSKIYFLTPSDLRPPTAPGDKEPEPPASAAAASELPRYDAGSRLSYIQVGAYSSRAVLEDTMMDLGRIAPGYPLSVDTFEAKGGTVYKLLIGPLSPAEMGIVLKTARSTSFPDAFPYHP